LLNLGTYADSVLLRRQQGGVKMSEPRIDSGMRIISADGKLVGTVADVTRDAFKVHVRWAPDYWLGNEIVDYVSDDNVVQLLITKNAVGGARLRAQRGLNTAV
jgi:hypothetical protein